MYEMLKEFIKPELLSLIPVLYFFGETFKISQIDNKHIPFLLGCISVILSGLSVLSSSDVNGWKDALMAVFSFVTQGVLCAGASVYVNQLVKQYKKGKQDESKGE